MKELKGLKVMREENIKAIFKFACCYLRCLFPWDVSRGTISEGTGVLGEKVKAALAAGGSCVQGSQPWCKLIFNQAVSPSVLSNFWPGSGQAEGKRGVSNFTHKHTHTNTHTQLYTLP